ncbi:hypothetical protein [Nocardioides coralli]|uniref:hypothetical protein n=1 Tax=Nocardioides coralli TaxID=2872154 RepID=UPI001CA434E5|nr:hypothetical protein [Nocardioides coralli]QZY29121.1 hypothetical protein K6T13_17110 [Nocardioides coralli]
MTSTTTSARPTSLGRSLVIGIGAGVLASLVMALYAMGASWLKDTGFLTPLYHIASLVTAPDAMMTSMEAGMAGEAVRLEAGPALVGALIHMTTGAFYGVLFTVVAVRLHVGAAVLAGLGLLWGAVVFVLSAFVALPAAATVFDAGEPIRDMAEMAGWGTFLAEHLLFGVVLGLLVAAWRRGSRTVE